LLQPRRGIIVFQAQHLDPRTIHPCPTPPFLAPVAQACGHPAATRTGRAARTADQPATPESACPLRRATPPLFLLRALALLRRRRTAPLRYRLRRRPRHEPMVVDQPSQRATHEWPDPVHELVLPSTARQRRPEGPRRV